VSRSSPSEDSILSTLFLVVLVRALVGVLPVILIVLFVTGRL
jgi:hypothetical protein